MKLQTEHGAAFGQILITYVSPIFSPPTAVRDRKNRLSIFSFIGKVRDVWLVR
jgi:hypothetical protein